MKTLVIIPFSNFYHFDKYKNASIDVICLLKNSYINHARFYSKFPSCFSLFFLNDIDYKKYDKIIIFDIVLSLYPKFLKVIKNKVKGKKVFIYKWNNVYDKESELIKLLKRNSDFITVYDYDKDQCNLFDFKLNTIIFNDQITIKDNIQYDCIYLGSAKKRYDDILKTADILEKINATYKMIIISNNLVSNNKNIEIKQNRAEYDEYLKLIGKTNIILDFTNNNQKGLTIRFMEALFLNKKIITNNLEYKNTMFFDSPNIFYLSDSVCLEDLKRFINSPFVEWDTKIKNYYAFEQWIERFN